MERFLLCDVGPSVDSVQGQMTVEVDVPFGQLDFSSKSGGISFQRPLSAWWLAAA